MRLAVGSGGINIGALAVVQGVNLEYLAAEGIWSLSFVDAFVNDFTHR